MKDANAVTKQDLELKNSLLSCNNVSFTLGGEHFEGISQIFHPIKKVSLPSALLRVTENTGISSKGMCFTVTQTEHIDYPAVSWVADATNRGKADSDVLENFALTATLKGSGARLSVANGDTRNEDGFTRTTGDLDFNSAVISPSTCRGSEGASPFVVISFNEYSVLLAIGWPGKWRLMLKTVKNGIEFSLSQANFSSVIHPMEHMRTPSVTAFFWQGDYTRGINMWRRFYFAHVCPREADGSVIKPRMFLHTYEIQGKQEFCGITTDNQLNAIDEFVARGLKPDAWWIDAGWYSCNDNWFNTGDWYPNPDTLPDGFAPIGKKCKDNGIELLVWFEPERAYAGSRFEYQHPEWLLYCHNDDGETDKSRLVNLANPDCLEFVINMIDGLIKSGGINIYRQDFNFTPDKYWEQNEEPDRRGSLENLHIQGILKLFDELRLRNPGLMFDICASGGTRNEMEFLSRAVPLQFSDVGLGNPVQRQKQYREMFSFMPYFRSHNYEDFSSAQKGRRIDEYTYLCALTPAMTSLIDSDDTEQRFIAAKKMTPIWRKAAELEIEGDCYFLSGDSTEWYAVQFHSAEKNRGFIEVIRNKGAKDTHFTVYPFVEDDTVYMFENAVTGEQKRTNSTGLLSGLDFYSSERRGELWFYSAEKKEKN